MGKIEGYVENKNKKLYKVLLIYVKQFSKYLARGTYFSIVVANTVLKEK